MKEKTKAAQIREKLESYFEQVKQAHPDFRYEKKELLALSPEKQEAVMATFGGIVKLDKMRAEYRKMREDAKRERPHSSLLKKRNGRKGRS